MGAVCVCVIVFLLLQAWLLLGSRSSAGTLGVLVQPEAWPHSLEINVDDVQRRQWLVVHHVPLPLQDNVVTLHNYRDGPSGRDVFLPPVHFDWVTKVETKVLAFYSTVTCNHSAALMLDVGMNDGIYSLLSAARGCHVYAFELQKQCIHFA